MSSTFNSYNVATTGMYANQASLTVVSDNLSNINTPGYSRKQIVGAEQVTANSDGTASGSGVGVEEIRRARDCFLDHTYWQANASTKYLNAKNNGLKEAQSLLNEYDSTSSISTKSDNGLQQTIKKFFDSWEELTKDPNSQSTRSTVVENSASLVDTFNQINEQLTEMQQDSYNRVKDGVVSINTLAKDVSALNSQITQAERSGGEASDLRDQRDELLDQLSDLADISVAEQSNGTDNVTIGGVALVQGDTIHLLSAVDDGAGLNVEWAALGDEAKISNGSIKAYLEEANQSSVMEVPDSTTYNFTADGSSSLGTLRQGMNNLITTIANKVNGLLVTGTDLEGNKGVALFTKIDDKKNLIVGNIQVNSAIVADVNKIVTGTSGQPSDSTLASEITAIQNGKNFQYDASSMDLNSFYQSLISWVSTTGDTMSSNYDTQSTLLKQADNQRQSISAVSEDEELSKMITYQNGYNASARVLNVVDKLIGDLIHDLGSHT